MTVFHLLSKMLVNAMIGAFLLLPNYSCNKTSTDVNNQQSEIKALIAKLSADIKFRSLLNNHVKIHGLAINTSLPNSFFLSQDPLAHPFIERIKRTDNNDFEKLKRLYLTQFSAGDTIVELISQTLALSSKIQSEHQHLKTLNSAQISIVLQAAAKNVMNEIASKNELTPKECLVDYRRRLSICSLFGGFEAFLCSGLVVFPPDYAVCLAEIGGETSACVLTAVVNYVKCDPNAPSAPQ